MAWHNIKQVQELTGKPRSTLYRDMNAGRLSYRTELQEVRRIEHKPDTSPDNTHEPKAESQVLRGASRTIMVA